MYNTNKPTADELPSSQQLLKSTLIALITAAIILVTMVLPAEYGIDPTCVGKMLNLTEMGEIKQQLHEEAEADHQRQLEQQSVSEPSSQLLNNLFGVFMRSAHANAATETEAESAPETAVDANAAEDTEAATEAADTWTDTFSYTLKRGEGIEVKLVMEEDAEAEFLWEAEGGVLNYDLHGDGDGRSISYKKGRGVPGDENTLTAAFTGKHGWFWRNRDKQAVTMTLYVRGDYSDMVLMK